MIPNKGRFAHNNIKLLHFCISNTICLQDSWNMVSASLAQFPNLFSATNMFILLQETVFFTRWTRCKEIPDPSGSKRIGWIFYHCTLLVNKWMTASPHMNFKPLQEFLRVQVSVHLQIINVLQAWSSCQQIRSFMLYKLIDTSDQLQK